MFQRLGVGVLVAVAALSLVLVLGVDSPVHAHQKGKTKSKAADKDGKDDLVGARWKVTVSEDGKNSAIQAFRADKFKLYKVTEEIGTYKESKNKEELSLEFTSGPLAGTMEVKLIRKNGSVYAGDWKPKDGGTKKVKLELLDD